jgi:hypothetical protein
MEKRKKSVGTKIPVFEGCGNIFADLNLEDSEELQVKSGLTRQVFNRIKELKLTQTRAALFWILLNPIPLNSCTAGTQDFQ